MIIFRSSIWHQYFYQGLTSTIPTEFGRLTKLVFVDFDFNELSGSIPSEMYLLTNLSTLDLNDNQLTGNIDQIGDFVDLEFLQLQSKLCDVHTHAHAQSHTLYI